MGVMLRCTKPLWGSGKVVVMDSGFCVAVGLREMFKKGVYGHALIKMKRYWPRDVPGDDIDALMSNNSVGEVDGVTFNTNDVVWHVFCLKEPEYVMKIMTTYGTLQEMGDGETKRTIGDGANKKQASFKYTEVFYNHFKYRHHIDDHNNRLHGSGVSIEHTWGTKYWPDHSFDWFLSVSEVNANLARAHFVHSENVMQQVIFRKI